MNQDLIHRIVYHLVWKAKTDGVTDLGATKLVKLLYLIDYEYFRWHRQTATIAPWIFYHYGPYCEELVTEAKATPGIRFLSPVDLDGERTFRGCELTEQKLNPLRQQSLALKATVDKICERWLAADLPTLLNHVYFDTEPMQNATRGTLLDFSKIPDPRTEPKPETVPDVGALVSDQTKNLLRQRMAAKRHQFQSRPTSVRVELDEDARTALQKMDAEDTTGFSQQKVRLVGGHRIEGG